METKVAIIYEVNLKVTQTIYNHFMDWLRFHIDEMLQYPGFLEATLYHDISGENSDNIHYQYIVVVYKITSMENLQYYFDHHALLVREKGIKQFGDQFSAQRRILQILQVFSPYETKPIG